MGRVLGRAVAASALVGLLALPGVASPQPLPTRQTAEPGARADQCGGTLEPRPPIAIANAVGFTPENGVRSGTGTPADPFVIECWDISVPDGGFGIDVGTGARFAVSFVIRDVRVTGSVPPPNPPRGSGIRIRQIEGAVTVDHVTAERLLRGVDTITVGSAATPLQLTNTSLLRNDQGLTDIASVDVVIAGNVGSDNISRCINRNSTGLGETQPRVEGNTCRGGGGAAEFRFSGLGLVASGNLAEGRRAGTGFVGTGAVTLRDNVARHYQTGFFIEASDGTAERNTAESNIVGFDITIAVQATLRDNTAVHNGSTGFQGFAIQNIFPTHRNILEGNKVGWNPFGIVFEFMNNSNEVTNTEWLDGKPSYIRFTDPNTIVDAGSNYRGVPGEPTRFHDWIAVVTVGNDPDDPVLGLRRAQVAVVQSAQWEFGDGQTLALDPPVVQGQAPPDVTHTYASAGEYTATLTVTGLNNLGETITLRDTTKVTIAASAPGGVFPVPAGHEPWPSLANDPTRTFYNGAETTITPGNVAGLGIKWRFPTTEPVTATPAVATIDVSGTPAEIVFDGSYSGTMYALRSSTGAPLWINCLIEGDPEPFCDPQSPQQNPNDPNASRQQAYGAIVDSPAVAKVALPDGTDEERVFIGVGGADAHMVALDADTGEERWRFTAGTEFPTYSISGSPIVIGDSVLFGMDCNNRCKYGGGIFSVNAVTGNLEWFWDVHSGANFVAPPGTMVFDPIQMRGNPPQEISQDCGAVWSSPAVDVELGLAYVGTADCADVPMADHEEAVVALNLETGAPVWRFQPRQIDKRDMDFGATPNVFKIGDRHVVGAAGKDGVYYALDAQNGDEIWSTKLALGGNFGGFYGTAVDGERIYLTNALAEATDFQTAHEERARGTEFALDARTGNVLWIQPAGSPSVGMNSVSPGIYWTGGLDHNLHAWDAATGALLGQWNVQGAVSSAPAIARGHVYLGAGTGATYRAAVGDSVPDPFGTGLQPTFPHPIPISEYGQGIYSLCLTTDPACAESRNDPESAKRQTIVTYNGATTGDFHDAVTLSGRVQEALALGAAVQGGQVTFSLAGQSCTATSAADGTASCSVHLDEQPGDTRVDTRYEGDATRRTATDRDPFTVTKEQTAVTYVGPTRFTDGEDARLSTRLTEDDGTPIAGRNIQMSIGSYGPHQGCSADTNADGVATCNIGEGLDEPENAWAENGVSLGFYGDAHYHRSFGYGELRITRCPRGQSADELGTEPPVAAGGAMAGAPLGLPFLQRRRTGARPDGRARRSRQVGRVVLMIVAVAGVAVLLAGCDLKPSPTPGC